MSMRSVPDTIAITCATVLSVLVIVVITGNSTVCTIILKYRDMRIPINFLLVNLAVSDIMIAIFLAPEYIFSLMFTHPNGVTGTVLCRLLTGGNFAWVGASSSVFTLVFIAIERYYAVIYPYDEKGKLTHTKLKNTLGDCEEDWPQEWMGIANSMNWLVTMTVLPMTLMTAAYSRIVCTLWFTPTDDNQLSHRQKAVIKLRKRVTAMVITVSFIFGVCWLTDSTFYFLHFINSPYSDVVFYITTILILFNSAVNPFVYALINQRFRQKIKTMFRCNCVATNRIGPTIHSTGKIVLPTVATTLPNLQDKVNAGESDFNN